MPPLVTFAGRAIHARAGKKPLPRPAPAGGPMRTSFVASVAAALLAAAPSSSRPAEPEQAAPPAPDAPEVKIQGAGPGAEAKPEAPAPSPAPVAPPGTGAGQSGAKAAAAREEPGEEIVVTATRTRRAIGLLPVAVDVISRAEVDRSPTKTIDELLRIDPSFALFRRSSSVAADPSSQGVKLRGVGTSGVSRTLVLIDGIPENDPFGGWVAWRSIPRAGIQSIEVVPGGASAVYGNYALGGVVQVLSRPLGERQMEVTSEGGSFGTGQISAMAMDRLGPVRTSIDGEFLTSEGYRVVAPYQRGSIDGDTPSKHATVRMRAEGDATSDLSYSLRGGYFWEDLNGGTEFTTAMARRFEYAGTARWAAGAGGAFDLAVFGHTGEFQQNRTAPGAGRNSELQSAHQDVPTNDVGSSLLWTARPLQLAGTHTFNAGADGRWIGGETVEHLLTSPTTSVRDAKGQQWLYGAFVQDNYLVTQRIGLDLAVRYDRWDNVAASARELGLTGLPTAKDRPSIADRSSDAFSPKAGVRVRAVDWLALRAAAYQSFRAPTLDELYRPFQVGTVLTNANPDLGPETLRGAETGFDVLSRGATARVTGFWNQLDNPITNVTCTAANPCPGIPTGQRQRQNLGAARIRGVEASGSWTFLHAWSLGAAYTYAENEITDAPGIPSLVGKRLPQDPLHMASASLSFADARLVDAKVQLRYLGRQYEDDQNTQPMGEAWLFDVYAAWHMTRQFDLFLAVENLLDRTYLVGRAGVDTIGSPRFIHGGVRFRTGG
jgi:outer membrane receptor protein involved in Fe transport